MNFPHVRDALFARLGEENSVPEYRNLHDPLLLPDMEKARDRIIEAMLGGEHIMVFADYDADGIPGAVVMSDFFKRSNYANVSFYIPHRHDEGFGLNMQAMDEALKREAKLIITIDCGTADKKEIEYANSLGIDVIITDHHLPAQAGESDDLPPAFAVVNPKRKDSVYPWKELCGSGVAYKLVQAILLAETFGAKPGAEKWSLDMVGIATLSDMVPLRGENRILAKFGLDVLRKSPRPGLHSLFDMLRMNQTYLNEDDVAFMITPRINAASRMGVPMDAFTLLATTDQREAEKFALHLEKINQERKGLVASIVKDAKKHLDAREKLDSVIVVGNPEWRPALCGLVANKLVEDYGRPAFVWGRDGDNMIKGSCRTDGADLFELMNKAAESFKEFGGHAGAGGFSVETEKIHLLEAALSEAYNTSPPTPLLDKERGAAHIPLALHDIGEDLWGIVSAFAPFGTGNEKPVFKLENVPILSVKQFGKEKNHLELTLPNRVKAIAFFASPSTYNLEPSTPSCTLLANLEKSYFMNRPELRLRIVDILL